MPRASESQSLKGGVALTLIPMPTLPPPLLLRLCLKSETLRVTSTDVTISKSGTQTNLRQWPTHNEATLKA